MNVTVIESGTTGQEAATTVTVSGVTTAELTPGGSGDDFTVRVRYLDIADGYELHTAALNGSSAAFDQDCTDFSETDDISWPSATENYTVYGCVATGTSIWAWVEELDGTVVASSDFPGPRVNVKKPTVSLSEETYSVDEGDDATVEVQLSHKSSDLIFIPITVSNGTAESGDYEVDGLSSSGTLFFAGLATSATFTIDTDDDADTDDETVNIRFGTLPSTVSGTGSPSRATLTIVDPDRTVRFGESSYSVNEDSSVTVEVLLNRAPGRRLSIPVRVSPGTDRTIRFGSNSDSETFTYTPPDDDDCDDETVSLSFGRLPSGVEEGSPDESEIAITDDDACVSFDSASYSVREGSSVEVEVNRVGNASGSLGIPISVTLGSAESGDYTVSDLPGGILWFGGGDDSATFTIKANQDDFDCEDETIEVGFGTLPTGAITGSQSSATVTIDDDDACAPAKVVNLSGALGSVHGEIALTWDAASGATGYEVRQKKPRPPLPDEWIALPADGFEVEIVGTAATVRNLDPDTTYKHQVRGVNVHGEGVWSDSVETAPRDERPATPTGLMGVIMRGGRGIILSWQAVADAQKYDVESTFGTQTTTEPASMASINLVEMTPEAVHSFRVRSRKSHGSGYLTSGWSSPVSYIAPTPSNIGHQEDHTVEYEVGSITSAPGLPAGVPDPATVISAALAYP